MSAIIAQSESFPIRSHHLRDDLEQPHSLNNFQQPQLFVCSNTNANDKEISVEKNDQTNLLELYKKSISRLSTLDKTIEFLQNKHADTLRNMHNEIARLQNSNAENAIRSAFPLSTPSLSQDMHSKSSQTDFVFPFPTSDNFPLSSPTETESKLILTLLSSINELKIAQSHKDEEISRLNARLDQIASSIHSSSLSSVSSNSISTLRPQSPINKFPQPTLSQYSTLPPVSHSVPQQPLKPSAPTSVPPLTLPHRTRNHSKRISRPASRPVTPLAAPPSISNNVYASNTTLISSSGINFTPSKKDELALVGEIGGTELYEDEYDVNEPEGLRSGNQSLPGLGVGVITRMGVKKVTVGGLLPRLGLGLGLFKERK